MTTFYLNSLNFTAVFGVDIASKCHMRMCNQYNTVYVKQNANPASTTKETVVRNYITLTKSICTNN